MAQQTTPISEEQATAIQVRHLNFYYGAHQALKDISLDIPSHQVTAFIGPSGCGKSTLLRCFNRMNDVITGTRVEGKVTIEGEDIYQEGYPLEPLRKKVGMVFQRPNPFPMTIQQNIVFGPKMAGLRDKARLESLVESSLKQADLWSEVKDRLSSSALDLSGGQQQRLCIARALANEPDILLMDEPASALDPISTAKIEETIRELQSSYTIVIVTHNMQQAARISSRTALFWMGELVEFGDTNQIFTNPKKKLTDDYVTGRSG